MKYALTCGVNAAVKANVDSAVKRFYLKQTAKGKSPQDAEVAAARKLACVVWRILTSNERYVEEDKYLTARKMKRLSQTARRPLKHITQPGDVPYLIASLKTETDVLERYPQRMDGVSGRNGRCRRRSSSSTELASEVGGEVTVKASPLTDFHGRGRWNDSGKPSRYTTQNSTTQPASEKHTTTNLTEASTGKPMQKSTNPSCPTCQ